MTTPVARLYKHVLESIFSHLNLSELGRISAVCRDWSAAVDSMRPIGARLAKKGSWLESMRTPLLMRHVFGIHLQRTSISASELSNLCAIIKQSKSLATVYLFETDSIDDLSVPAIAEAIAQSKSLTTVDLICNSIGAVGAAAIAEAIAQSKVADLGDFGQ